MVEEDLAIDNFGITARLSDDRPLVQLPRQDFEKLASTPILLEAPPTERRRQRRERVRLVIIKAWLLRGNRKWAFEWNGVPVSAPIKDDSFFDRMESHEVLIGQGDAIDVELVYEQEYDDAIRLYVNDSSSFVIARVFGVVPSARQIHMLRKDPPRNG